MVRKFLLALTTSATLFVAGAQSAYASDPGCHDARLFQRLITDFCWSCIFPLKVVGITMAGGKAPDEANSTPFCYCNDNLGVPRPGIATSMWEPARMIEFQRVSGCSSVLGGHRFPFRRTFQATHGDGEDDGSDKTFMHYHYYAFPLLMMMELFIGNCNSDGYVDLDLMYLSEVDPTWTNDELAFFTNPEAAAVANPAAIVACSADAISATAGKPLKQMFWCAGSWGAIYPLSGNTQGGYGPVQDSSLLKTRTLAALHRRGLAFKTMGSDAMCGGYIHPTLPKTQYKFTMFHPVPETKTAHVIGESLLTWGWNRTVPGIGRDPVYTIWRWNDCCNH